MVQDSWIIDLQHQWESTNSAREREIKHRRCIYKVPQFIWDIRGDCYAPQVISLGPYHHGDNRLKQMEKQKEKILGRYLAKIGKTLEDAAAAMGAEARDLMDAYDQLEEPWMDEGRFVRLMVVDGCFLLGWLYFTCDLEDDEMLRCCYEEIEPVSFTIGMDVIMLENQLPRRALEIMANLGGEKVPTTNVSRLLLKHEIDDNIISKLDYSTKFTHKLHAVWFSRLITNDFLFKSTYEREVNPPTITELVEAGVQIEKATSMSITFERGVLKLPNFTFVDDIRCIYHNLMAFEKMHNLDPEFFSFVEFMDCLIDTKDVEFLRRKGIIDGAVGSELDVADFFNWVTRRAFAPKRKRRTSGVDVAKLLAGYCGKWQNRWYASFKHLYLENPWAFISLLGAIFLLKLTVLSTIYTVLAYYRSS